MRALYYPHTPTHYNTPVSSFLRCVTTDLTDCAKELFESPLATAEKAADAIEEFAVDLGNAVADIADDISGGMAPLIDAMDYIQKPLVATFSEKGCEDAGGQMVPSGVKYPISLDIDFANFDLGIGWQNVEYCELPKSALQAMLWKEEVVEGVAGACSDLLGVIGVDDEVCDLFDYNDPFASMDATQGKAILGSCDGDWSLSFSINVGIGVRTYLYT